MGSHEARAHFRTALIEAPSVAVAAVVTEAFRLHASAILKGGASVFRAATRAPPFDFSAPQVGGMTKYKTAIEKRSHLTIIIPQ